MMIEFLKWSGQDEYGEREYMGCRLLTEAQAVNWLNHGGALETLRGVYFEDDNIPGLIALFDQNR